VKLADLLLLAAGVLVVLALGAYLGADTLEHLNGARP
jgi:hypothetical protein